MRGVEIKDFYDFILKLSNDGGLKCAGVHPVAQKQPNAWGLHDMHGNLWEWCQDWYGDYSVGTIINSRGPSLGDFRVLRGGCWGSKAAYCRAANRYRNTSGYQSDGIGFRLAVPLFSR
jgi:formylglycine-generating enzyme required for sulfatase activity